MLVRASLVVLVFAAPAIGGMVVAAFASSQRMGYFAAGAVALATALLAIATAEELYDSGWALVYIGVAFVALVSFVLALPGVALVNAIRTRKD